jgi:plasmid stabilization system protein ParE
VKIKLSLAARRDRQEAVYYYRSSSPAAESRFRADLHSALTYISEYPLGSPKLVGEFRGKTLLHYPYTVLYAVETEFVLVLAIANEYRDPDVSGRPM